jgi:ABC-2 type transport system ATP-binding protein
VINYQECLHLTLALFIKYLVSYQTTILFHSFYLIHFMSDAIFVKNLKKSFLVKEGASGFKASLKSLLFPNTKEIVAINNLSFRVQEGEKIAFIGPNGAGKSTTIKMLTGILYPTSGEITVLGLTPWQNRHDLGYKIGTVFGQRSQLWYHLPPLDSFNLLAKIYELDDTAFKKRLHDLIAIFELENLLYKPVRQLSLGERMRCELVASLLHKPQILFLDEPTIGLDLNAKLQIRTLLNRLSLEHGTTLFLTSHDTADIEQVSERVLILDNGSLIMDSTIYDLKKTYYTKKVLRLVTEDETLLLNLQGVEILETSKNHFTCEVDLLVTPIEKVIQEALKQADVKDITIEDPSMEEIIRDIYGKSIKS